MGIYLLHKMLLNLLKGFLFILTKLHVWQLPDIPTCFPFIFSTKLTALFAPFYYRLFLRFRKRPLWDLTSSSWSCFHAVLLAGLITNSPRLSLALCSLPRSCHPLMGIGLTSLTGEAQLAEPSFSALLRRAFLAILLAIIMTFVSRYSPFVVLQNCLQK